VFTRPREAIDCIVASQSRHLILPLATIGGISFYVGKFLNTGFVFFTNWRALLLIAAVGAVIGIVGVCLSGLVYCWIGRLIGGRASPLELRAAWAWSMFPSIFGFLVAVAVLLMSRPFNPDNLMIPSGQLLSIRIVADVSYVWGVVVFLVMVSHLHRLTMWRAIVIYAVGTAVIIAIAFLVRAVLGHLLHISPNLFDIRQYLLTWLP
jgi:hypothetical protein